MKIQINSSVIRIGDEEYEGSIEILPDGWKSPVSFFFIAFNRTPDRPGQLVIKKGRQNLFIINGSRQEIEALPPAERCFFLRVLPEIHEVVALLNTDAKGGALVQLHEGQVVVIKEKPTLGVGDDARQSVSIDLDSYESELFLSVCR